MHAVTPAETSATSCPTTPEVPLPSLQPRLASDTTANAICGQTEADAGRRHSVYGSFEEAGHLKRAWNDLACRVGDLFCSYDWCEIWWRHFGRGRRLEIHSLHEGNRLVGVLPLFREVLLAGWVCLHVVRLAACDYASEAAGLAVEADAADSFFRMVLASLTERGSWDVLHLGPLRSYVPLTEQVGQICAGSALVQGVIIGRKDNWLTLYDLFPTYEGYLQSLPRHERHDLLRRQRRLCEAHDVQVSVAQTPQEVRQGMDAVIQLHQKIWTGKGHRGYFGAWPNLTAFHRDVAERMLPTGQLALLTLTVDGQIVGASYGYHFGARTHGIVRGYCNQGPWRNLSLGKLLHCKFVEQAVGRGSNVFESGRGVFDYKIRLGGRLHGEQSITVVRQGWKSRLRLWAAMRISYLIHAVYGRIWLDIVSPRLGLHPHVRDVYVRHSFLAQLHRRVRFRLFGGHRVQEAGCGAALPADNPKDS